MVLQRGCQPLHNAAYNGQAETVQWLLTNNANIFAKNKVSKYIDPTRNNARNAALQLMYL